MQLFNTINYLQLGTLLQQQAYTVLTANTIMEKLQDFTPILAGTIPLNIDIEGSDLDILCYWEDEADFVKTIRDNFKDYDGFTLQQVIINNQKTVLANFWYNGFEVEVFGQNIPVKEQMGYLHMIAEYKILQQEGEDFRKQVIALKRAGYKTEPAFAKLLNLKGDPYIAILQY
ncbi:diadenosine tetraphosphate hydrolase [Flavobacterium rivuli WB 3.3-2 = DSM 21788]|uniref:Diadenosine tetraphosphate hydrolase n=1 Tax=Flavobacterium rivuli WB 3.3-2 = DSM 21788 TaxID=1121895 RepID=A0A0A2LXM6_9FLAO|nr:DUF4269 domain-containing protein [Flavobacterium rivuli]KGO84724.1 diadenosine tetraphosphate hydrolase [Flavobacterium rivuli WB 3.3-2 = DSM 21788]